MNTIHKITLALAAVLLALAPILAAAADKGTVRMGLNNWAENVAAANMWKVLLEDRSYEVELTETG